MLRLWLLGLLLLLGALLCMRVHRPKHQERNACVQH